jgi:Na+-translocating ferredoxin:NAD+ oxidoreductase RnfG subunit
MIVKLIAAITVSILLIAFGVKSIFAILVAQAAITLLISILEQNSIDNQLDKNCSDFKKEMRKYTTN